MCGDPPEIWLSIWHLGQFLIGGIQMGNLWQLAQSGAPVLEWLYTWWQIYRLIKNILGNYRILVPYLTRVSKTEHEFRSRLIIADSIPFFSVTKTLATIMHRSGCLTHLTTAFEAWQNITSHLHLNGSHRLGIFGGHCSKISRSREDSIWGLYTKQLSLTLSALWLMHADAWNTCKRKNQSWNGHCTRLAARTTDDLTRQVPYLLTYPKSPNYDSPLHNY